MKRQNVTDEMMKKVEFVEETLHVAVEHTRDALDGNDEVTDVNIQWKGTADNVLVSGEFSNWSGISLAKIEEEVWSVQLKLKFGDYLMFFFVDGEIIIVEDMEQVHCKDEDEIYNILRVLPEMDTELDFKDEATAKDAVQAFITRLIEKDSLTAADPERGKFRAFLISDFCWRYQISKK